MSISDRRSPSLKALDAEANQRFGEEPNRRFGGGTYTHTLYGPRADQIKHQAAKAEVDKLRAYSGYLSAGMGLLMAYCTSGYGMPVSFVVGTMSALAMHFSQPLALDKLEELYAEEIEVKQTVTQRVEVRAYYA